jgi:hypothetical protein
MESTTNTMEIAQTIINQIKYCDRWALMAWGARDFVALPESKIFAGGLRIKVTGLTFKGWVTIQLRWLDDYTLKFINRKGEVVKIVEQMYCDQLVEVIDWIEGR